MRKVFASSSLSIWLAILAIGIFAPSGRLSASEEAETEKMISAAKTAADHEALAAEYERGAETAKKNSAKHHEMAAAYRKAGGALIEKQHLDAHCESLAKLYEKVAKENDALAKGHHAMAEKAK